MKLLIGFLIGHLVGLIFCFIFAAVKISEITIGRINIDNSEPNELPKLFLELDVPVNKFKDNHYAIVEITKKDYLPHK